MTERTGACPRCSRARLGFLRYCIECGFDFDAPDPAVQAPVPPTTMDVAAFPALPRSAALLGAPLPPAPPRTVLPPAPRPIESPAASSVALEAPPAATPEAAPPAATAAPAVAPAAASIAPQRFKMPVIARPAAPPAPVAPLAPVESPVATPVEPPGAVEPAPPAVQPPPAAPTWPEPTPDNPTWPPPAATPTWPEPPAAALPPPPAVPASRPLMAASPTAPSPRATPAAPRQIETATRVRPGVQPQRSNRQRLIGQLALVAVAVVLGVTALSTALLPQTEAGLSSPPQSAASVGPGTTLPVSGGSASVGLGPTGQTETAIVTDVVDGDTIRVRLGDQERDVRYIGIDTPEPDDVDPVTRALAEVAAAQNAALVDGRAVILERDVSETDEFDRLLRHVWLEADGQYVLVNLELVRMGLAQVATYPPDVRYASDFRAAQALARRAGAGLWRASAEPSAPVIIDDRLFFIEEGSRERFEGGEGSYRWTALAFIDGAAVLRWIATAPADDACAVTWTLEPTSGAEISGSIDVPHAGQETGDRSLTIPFSDAALAVTSTCQSFAVAIEG